MKFKLHIEDQYFNLIAQRKKTLEGRLNKVIRTFIAKGDIIIFVNKQTNNQIECEVTEIKHFKSIPEMVNGVDLNALGFEGQTKQDAIKVYQGFYNEQDVNRLGMVVLGIKRI
ncbi:MAG: ASCH domain-containing protein [Bacilli bacterium]|nr:ASCH domain-containing protein [Bacilli bacterium]